MRKKETEKMINDVLMVLRLSGSKPISREELSSMTRIADRQVRGAIEELRRRGEPIGQAPKGGYTYDVDTDVNRATKDYYAKAFSNIITARALEKRPLSDQEVIDLIVG